MLHCIFILIYTLLSLQRRIINTDTSGTEYTLLFIEKMNARMNTLKDYNGPPTYNMSITVWGTDENEVKSTETQKSNDVVEDSLQSKQVTPNIEAKPSEILVKKNESNHRPWKVTCKAERIFDSDSISDGFKEKINRQLDQIKEIASSGLGCSSNSDGNSGINISHLVPRSGLGGDSDLNENIEYQIKINGMFLTKKKNDFGVIFNNDGNAGESKWKIKKVDDGFNIMNGDKCLFRMPTQDKLGYFLNVQACEKFDIDRKFFKTSD